MASRGAPWSRIVVCGGISVKGSHAGVVEYALDEKGRLKEQMPRATRRLLSAKPMRKTRVVRVLTPEHLEISPSSEATDEMESWFGEPNICLDDWQHGCVYQ